MSVRIISDSACDMTAAEARERGVTLVPLKTIIDGVEYLDGVTITPEEFYDRLAVCREMPRTSLISPDEFSAVCDSVLEPGDEALIITLSGELSGTAQSAAIAAEDYPGRVWVVDSRSACVGQRILLEYALRLRAGGWSAGDMARELDRVKSRSCLVARVDTLEYLMRGGRLSRTAAVAGTVLNIKPVLGIEEGRAVVLGKARGARMSGNLLTRTIESRGGIDFSMPFMLSYSGRDDSLLREYIEGSRRLWEGQAEELPVCLMGSTIGAHAGPGAVVVAFFSREA